MSTRHDDDPAEHDPTGIRQLLAALPDPGPMPPDLVARISSALAEEARAAGTATPGQAGPPTGSDDARPARVVPLRRRSRWHLLGAAAAVAGVVGFGGLVVSQLSGGLEASLGVTSGAGDEAGGQGYAPGRQEGADSAGGTDGTDVQVVRTGVAYTSADLGDQARLVAGDTAERPNAVAVPDVVDGAPAGAVADPAGALACAGALGPGSWSAVVVDVATVDGAPAAVLVLTDPSGGRAVYAVQRSCGPGAPGLIRGPVALG